MNKNKNKWEVYHIEQALAGICQILQFPLHLQDFSEAGRSVRIGRGFSKNEKNETFQPDSDTSTDVDSDSDSDGVVVDIVVKLISELTGVLTQTLPLTPINNEMNVSPTDPNPTDIITSSITNNITNTNPNPNNTNTTSSISAESLEFLVVQCIDKIKWTGGVLAGVAMYRTNSGSNPVRPDSAELTGRTRTVSRALSLLMNDYLLPLNHSDLDYLESLAAQPSSTNHNHNHSNPMAVALTLTSISGGVLDNLAQLQADHAALSQFIQATTTDTNTDTDRDCDRECVSSVEMRLRLAELTSVVNRLVSMLQ